VSVAQLIVGIICLNLVFVLVGYSALMAFLRGLPAATWVTFAGVALLVGAGLVGIVLSGLAVAGSATSLPVFGAVTLALAGLGVGIRASASRAGIRFQAPAARTVSVIESWVAAVAAGGAVAVCCLVVVAAFRASPWLDDAWTFWLPKGVELSRSGLDQRVFLPHTDFVSFANPHYPLWWSIVGGLDVAVVGRIDVRALDAQLAVLYIAFASAVGRLLWGLVRPAILLPAILLAVAAPELVAQTESGGADLPLAFYVALAVIAAAWWLQRGELLFLALTFVFAGTALNTKDEATGLFVVLLLVGGPFAWAQSSRRFAALVGAAAAAFATLAPWLVWASLHDVSSEAVGADAFDPAHLWEQRARLGPAAHAVTHQVLQPRGWFLAVPLLVVTSIALAIRERRVAWLAPPAMVAAGSALFVWIYWAGSFDLTYWLDTSVYRVVDSVVVAAAVALPVVAERFWQAVSGELAHGRIVERVREQAPSAEERR
jgi:hypothetical protein